MKVKRFDLYEELWTKSRTAYSNEHNIEFDSLKQTIVNHKIPMPSNQYMYQYKKGNILPKDEIIGENYVIELQKKRSEKEKLLDKWSYFDVEKKEELYQVYSNLEIPEKVRNFHKIIVNHRDYTKKERKLERESRHNPYKYNNYDKPTVLDTRRISNETLSGFYLLCDTLFKAVEKVGCSVELGKDKILIQSKSSKEIENAFNESKESTTLFVNDFTITLVFKDKNKRTKNTESSYPSFFDKPTGNFKCEIIGVYPWDNNGYGISKEFPGTHETDKLLSLIFIRIFELPHLLYESKIKYDKEVAERKIKEEVAERAKKGRKKEFNHIKELILEYKIHKELQGLSEFIKHHKVSSASMEDVLWYKETLVWLEDKDAIEKNLNQYQHRDLIEYLLDERESKNMDFNDSPYRY